MQNESIDIALEVANQVERLPEQYRVVAFRVLLEHSMGIRPAALRGPSITKISVSEEISFSEFLNEFEELKINPQKFAAIAYYYELQRQESSVTQEEIINTMIDAGLRPPANFPRDIRASTSTKSALLMPSKEPKNGQSAWQLTRTGRQSLDKLHKSTE